MTTNISNEQYQQMNNEMIRNCEDKHKVINGRITSIENRIWAMLLAVLGNMVLLILFLAKEILSK